MSHLGRGPSWGFWRSVGAAALGGALVSRSAGSQRGQFSSTSPFLRDLPFGANETVDGASLGAAMSGSRAGFKRLRRDNSLAVENALMADAEAETRDNKKALVPQEEEVRSEQAPRAASSVAAVGIRGHPGPGSLDKEAAARGAAMDEVPSHGSEIADFGGNAPSGGDGGPDVPGDARMQETENVQTFAEDQSASLMGVFCFDSYGVSWFNVPSESELAAEFDAHPNREEMINAVDNESESGIHPVERPPVALQNYKSAWMLRALDIEDGEPDLFLNACHACACRPARIWDNGSNFPENFIKKRRIAYYFQHQEQTMQRQLQLHANYLNKGINELSGQACELCRPSGIYNGSAPDTDLGAYDVESYSYTFIREDKLVEGHNRFFLQRKPKRRAKQRTMQQAADERRKEAMRGS